MMTRTTTILLLLAVLGTAVRGIGAERSEDELIGILKSNAGHKEKDSACRELVLAGTVKAVPTLSALLGDEKLSHMARYALEPIPDPSVDVALRGALVKLKGRPLVGVIGSVGMRRDTAATGPLVKLLTAEDREVAAAAARALGRLATPGAAEGLQRALANVPAGSRGPVMEGVFRCAETLAAGGQTEKALALYDRLGTLTDLPHQVRTGVLRGTVLARKERGLPLLIGALRHEDFRMVGAAVRTAMELPGGAVTRTLTAELGTLPSDTQVLLASALAKRGDVLAVPGLVDLAKGGAKPARVAAVRALAGLGDASITAQLVQLSGDADADVAGFASGALAALEGPEVDAALVATLSNVDTKVQCAAIDLLGQRAATSAVPALLRVARSGGDAARIEALGVLGELAGTDQLQHVVAILCEEKSAAALEAAEGALVAMCNRLSQPEADRVKIAKALYGDLPDGKQKDVTAKVAAMIARGEFSITASNGSFGDPAPGTPKRMRLDYRVDGVDLSETIAEQGVIQIRAGSLPPPATETLCTALGDATGPSKIALLRVLRSAGGEQALAAVRGSLATGRADVKRAAESALCNWPNAKALPALFQLAGSTKSSRTKILALRGCCRLIPLSDAPADRKLQDLKEALDLSERDDEKRMALSALADIGVVAALPVALSYVDAPGLKEEACLAVVSLGEALAADHAAEVEAALQVVVKATGSGSTKKRARNVLGKVGQSK